MENDIIEIKQAEMLAGITRSEIDIQIATAKQYPRDLNTVLTKIATYATMDRERTQTVMTTPLKGFQSVWQKSSQGLGET